MNARRTFGPAATLLLTFLAAGCATQAGDSPAPVSLAGTSWQLVQFQGGDDSVLVPDERSKYTLAFDSNGGVFLRFDCNRGNGTWKQTPPSGLAFGPFALTRALCAPPSISSRIVQLWPGIRSYVLRDDHLFMALMADGGIFEYEPTPAGGVIGN